MTLDALFRLQQPDGGFGRFHSLSQGADITTEKVLRRCLFLGLDKTNPGLKRILDYVRKCLNREIVIPDRPEKIGQWDHFLDLMFSAWLRLFDDGSDEVIPVVKQWTTLIESSIVDDHFDFLLYSHHNQQLFGKIRSGQRVIDPTNFYVVALLSKRLSEPASRCYFDYVLEKGIYYIYGQDLRIVPERFDDQKTIHYLNAIALAASYYLSSSKIRVIREWIRKHQMPDGNWIMQQIKPDGIVFPVAENWRKATDKIRDIRSFMEKMMSVLTA